MAWQLPIGENVSSKPIMLDWMHVHTVNKKLPPTSGNSCWLDSHKLSIQSQDVSSGCLLLHAIFGEIREKKHRNPNPNHRTF
jgi:hypothetical protein